MYIVYWTERAEAQSKEFDTNEMSLALVLMEKLRKQIGIRFISMSSEHPDCTSLLGVDSVSEGVLPNGLEYGWKKRRI